MPHLRKVLCAVLAFVAVLQFAILPVMAVETVSGTTVPTEETVTETVPATEAATEPTAEATVPAETVPAETVPAETIPEETIPEETSPQVWNTGIPLYYQTDYPGVRYGSGTIESSGCSITSLAMVATYLTGHTYMPDQLADYFGGCADNNIARLDYASQMLQLPYEKPGNWHETLRHLQEGKVAIVLMNSKSIFTDSQHFIVLTGMTEDGKILVNDPYAPNYDRWDLKNAFVVGFEPGDICCGYSGAWVYDKNAMPAEPFIYVEEEPERPEYRYTGIELTEEEINLLARVVWVEAQGECAEGQQAVAEVVLNRLVSASFGTTLKGVIYAEGQFRSAPYLEDAEPTQAQYEAIEAALYGPYVLPIDVVHFATYPVNENVWGQIGGHIFCYQG